MNPLLLVFLVECLLSPHDSDSVCGAALDAAVEYAHDSPDEVAPQPQPAYTLAISRSTPVYGSLGTVEFIGTGYSRPTDLGTYRICVYGNKEYSIRIDEDREVTQTTPWSDWGECRPIGFFGSDGVVRFSQVIGPETTSVGSVPSNGGNSITSFPSS